MPIVFIHGVGVRDDDDDSELPRRFGKVPWPDVQAKLREHVAPALSDDPDNVPIMRVYWGDLGARLAWGDRYRVARPESVVEQVDYRHLSTDELGSRLEDEVLGRTLDTAEWPEMIEAVWAVARHPETRTALDTCETPQAAEDFLSAAIEGAHRASEAGGGPNEPRWWENLGRQIKPAGDRVLARQRANMIAVLNRIRRPLEGYVPFFMGDLLAYLRLRGDALRPGPIPLRALEALTRAAELQQVRDGEPIVVLTHSMGGQIMYDLVTHFIPRTPEYRDLKIDFWCACGSQVGLFEELKLFLESSEEYGTEKTQLVPAPDQRHLGYWWNVWDHSDLMSYRAQGIIEGVDDTGFFLGMGIQHNHSAYLDSVDFYRTLAAKITVHLDVPMDAEATYQPRLRQADS